MWTPVSLHTTVSSFVTRKILFDCKFHLFELHATGIHSCMTKYACFHVNCNNNPMGMFCSTTEWVTFKIAYVATDPSIAKLSALLLAPLSRNNILSVTYPFLVVFPAADVRKLLCPGQSTKRMQTHHYKPNLNKEVDIVQIPKISSFAILFFYHLIYNPEPFKTLRPCVFTTSCCNRIIFD